MSDPATERYAAAPAPASLKRVQSFLNTRSTGRPPEADLLAGPASANSSLRALDWPAGPRLTTDDLPPLYELRAALQAQLEADRAKEPRTHPDLARHLEKLRWGVTIEDGRLALSPEGEGWRQVAGTVLGDILVAQEHELWARLKACRNPPARWSSTTARRTSPASGTTPRTAATSSTSAPPEPANANSPRTREMEASLRAAWLLPQHPAASRATTRPTGPPTGGTALPQPR